MRFLKSSAVLAAILVLTISLSSVWKVAAIIFTFETQYEYDAADPAWLTDLSAKESIQTISDAARSLTLTAQPDYPYTETPASFAEDVNTFCLLYALDENATRAAYIYLFDELSNNASLIESDTSDADIKAYLVSRGIAYPADADSDTLVLARALYVLLQSGAFDAVYGAEEITQGTSLETLVFNYMSAITGVEMDAISEWAPNESILSFDEYLLAVSKYALWTGGYTVSKDMQETEVFRMIALMSIEKQGITADDDLSFDELKIRYLAAMLGKEYDISCRPDDLKVAYDNDAVPFYILQLIGQEVSLTIRPVDYTYERAFELVAENTDRFDIDPEEFYADIYRYTTTLQYKRDSIWLYPTPYSSATLGENNATLSIKANGVDILNTTYNKIPLDPTLESQTIELALVYRSAVKNSAVTYFITVRQGKLSPDTLLIDNSLDGLDSLLNGGQTFDPSLYGEGYVPNSSSLVGSILDSMGLGISLNDLLLSSGTSYSTPSISSMLSTLAPTVDTDFSAEKAALSGTLTVIPDAAATVGLGAVSPGGLQTGTEIKGSTAQVGTRALQLASLAPSTSGSSKVLSGVGGLELYSVAQTVSSLMGTVVGSVVPIAGAALNEMLFDDGKESVLNVSLDNDINKNIKADNLSYISSVTGNAVTAFSGEQGLNELDLSLYLSQQPGLQSGQNAAAAPGTAVAPDGTRDADSGMRMALLGGISGGLALLAAIVIVCIVRKRRLAY